MAPSDDDVSELFDDDALPGASPLDRPVLLLDETEDGLGAAEDLDAGETGNAMLGELGDVADREPLSAEEAAVHIVDPERDDSLDG